MLGSELVAVAHDHRGFHDVRQFAHIPRPVVRAQALEELDREPLRRAEAFVE